MILFYISISGLILAMAALIVFLVTVMGD